MRTFPDLYKNKVASSAIKTAYENYDKYEDANYLSKLFGIEVFYVTQLSREAFRNAEQINDGMLEVVVASLPSFCGSCYMIIKYDDRMEAVKQGLNVNFA